ncbi:hypothetical protein GCM10007342_07410 [Staphylococcus pragensis]|nr:hypothetical protein GCM10007342_07410 [Staphylococcus pragensis]
MTTFGLNILSLVVGFGVLNIEGQATDDLYQLPNSYGIKKRRQTRTTRYRTYLDTRVKRSRGV